MTTKNPFQPGDVVMLKSGSVKMTILDVNDDYVKVIWFNASSSCFNFESVLHVILTKEVE